MERPRIQYSLGRFESASVPRRRSLNDEDDNEVAYKRQRTAVACNSCKNRKSRCNGERPACSTCIELGFSCVYRGPAKVPSSQTRELAWMKSRLQAVEDLLHSTLGLQGQDRAEIARASSEQSTPAAVPESNHNESSRDVIQAPCEDTVDGMGVITFADEATAGHFGLSSNSAFFGYITRVLESLTHASQRGGLTRDLTTTWSRPASPPVPPKPSVKSPTNPYLLPPREEIHKLVESFFSVTGDFFPFIHKASVLEMVEELDINKFSGVRKSWLCLLNAILAIGTSLDKSTPMKTREAASDVYFQRALILSPWTMSNTANLETLQALAVMTIYLQGMSRSSQTWKVHGLLVQAAFQLGVHSGVVSPNTTPLEQEVRTRTWYTCFVLDRVLSMAYGRPPLIHNTYVKIPLPLEIELDDIAESESYESLVVQSQASHSSCSLFIATIKLYLIQGNIIEDIYDQNAVSSKECPPGRLFSRVIQLDQDLNQWKQQLNPAVSLVSGNDFLAQHPQTWRYTRSQTVLTIRYLSARVLLYRKVLETLLHASARPEADGGDLDSAHPIAQAMIQTCADSAIMIIQITRCVDARNDMLPAWWFTVYHVFNAALVLFGIVCLHVFGDLASVSHTPLQLVQFLQTALEDLDLIGKETRIVRRCSKYLKKMIHISTSLSRNYASGAMHPRGSPVLPLTPRYNNAPSTAEESILTPLGADFGQVLIDDDFNFLDVWTNLVEPPSGQQL